RRAAAARERAGAAVRRPATLSRIGALMVTSQSTRPAPAPPADPLFQGYALGDDYDELFDRGLSPRPHYEAIYRRLQGLDHDELRRRKAMTDLSMLQDGVGFTVYRQEEGIERVWPMDPVPRIIPAHEWRTLERGLVQRLTALN